MRSSEEDDLTVPPLVNYLLVFLLISTVFAGDTDDINITGVKLGSLGEPCFRLSSSSLLYSRPRPLSLLLAEFIGDYPFLACFRLSA